jgi:hypothetical protein
MDKYLEWTARRISQDCSQHVEEPLLSFSRAVLVGWNVRKLFEFVAFTILPRKIFERFLKCLPVSFSISTPQHSA